MSETDDWERVFRAQLQILYVAVFFVFAVFWTFAELLMGNHRSAAVFGACIGGLAVFVLWAWRSSRMNLFAHVIMLLVLLAFSTTTYFTGGLRTTNVCVFLFTMVAAPCTLGKSGLYYSAASVLIAMGFQAAASGGYSFPDFSDSENIARDSFLTWFSSAVGIFIVLLAWEWLNLMTRRRMKAHEEALSQSTLQLREAQKMETLGRLAGGIAHDFNNLLTTIIGCAQLAREELDEDHVCRPDMDDVIDAGHRAAKLTQQLLAFSRRQVLKPARVNLNDVVSDMSEMLRRVFGEMVTLEISLYPELRDAMLDPGQTEQVFMNLALNAHESMPGGGLLRIETSHCQSPVEPSDTMVVLRIADTGCGMSQEVKEHIFDPFYSTKPSGTGLGLAVVYGIVQQQRGWIDVESTEGEGSSFTVYLPALEPAEPDSSSAQEPDSAMSRGAGEKLLVVEDEEAVRKYAEKLLSRAGYEVTVAQSGEEALKIIEDKGDGLMLVFSDVVLPGLSGLEVADYLHRKHPEVPVLLASGYSERLATTRDSEPPRFPFINKPYDAAELLAMIDRLLTARSEH